MHAALQWQLLTYRVPTDPARRRSYVQRKPKELGTVHLPRAEGEAAAKIDTLSEQVKWASERQEEIAEKRSPEVTEE